MEDIIIIGYGGHGRVLEDSIESTHKFRILGYTDIEKKESDLCYLGDDGVLQELFDSGVVNAAIGVGYLGEEQVRNTIYEKCRKIGFRLPCIVDSSAILSKKIRMGEGTYIGKGAIINSEVCLGKMCIINSGAIIEHESFVGDFTHIAIGSSICGNSKIGKNCLIGANTTVVQGLSIGDNVITGAGTVVTKNVKDNSKIVGVPFRYI